MSNLVFIQDQPIINLSQCNAIKLQENFVHFDFEQYSLYWAFPSDNQALVAYEAIKGARCTDLGKFEFVAEEVKDIYDRIN